MHASATSADFLIMDDLPLFEQQIHHRRRKFLPVPRLPSAAPVALECANPVTVTAAIVVIWVNCTGRRLQNFAKERGAAEVLFEVVHARRRGAS
ncbi:MULTISPECIES: hypothetical protein [unclassified Bradyrhizobium]|uniref:hypothetical protein n=1 Tax=unclassified Bradyrhizobium TaxID=2631580 RepID=UPI0012F4BBF1|nr:hypothetical protein [Bradyrhizobium sp. WSM1253]